MNQEKAAVLAERFTSTKLEEYREVIRKRLNMSQEIDEPLRCIPVIPYVFHNPRTISVFGKCGPRNIAGFICKAIEEKVSRPLFYAVESSVDLGVRDLLLSELSGRASFSLMRDDSTGLYRDLKRNVLDPVRRSLVTRDMKLRPPSQ